MHGARGVVSRLIITCDMVKINVEVAVHVVAELGQLSLNRGLLLVGILHCHDGHGLKT